MISSLKFSFRSVLSLLVITIVFTSCQTEGCTDPSADNYSSSADSDDGSCEFSRDKFLHSYEVEETCNSGEWNYTLTITPQDDSKNGVVLGNLGGWDTPANVLGTASGSELTFNDTQNGINFSGTGTKSGSILTLVYVAAVGADADTCTSVCTIIE